MTVKLSRQRGFACGEYMATDAFLEPYQQLYLDIGFERIFITHQRLRNLNSK